MCSSFYPTEKYPFLWIFSSWTPAILPPSYFSWRFYEALSTFSLAWRKKAWLLLDTPWVYCKVRDEGRSSVVGCVGAFVIWTVLLLFSPSFTMTCIMKKVLFWLPLRLESFNLSNSFFFYLCRKEILSNHFGMSLKLTLMKR